MTRIVRDRRSFLRWTVAGLSALMAASVAVPGAAQDWPSRPIRILVGFPPGGSPDVVARLIAERLGRRLGQSVVVESMAGAGGAIATEAVARSAPDGHTLVMLTGAHSGTAALRKSLPYHPVSDLGMISMVSVYPMMVVVPQDSPIRSLSDLIAKAKAEPGKVTYASNAPGSLHHLLGEWINIEAGTSMVAVPYRGSAQAIPDLLAGRVDAMIDPATTAIELVRAGKVRVLGVASSGRYPLLPDEPTVAETLPGIETMTWLGLATAPGTPRPIVDRLNAELRAILETTDMRERFAQLGGVSSPTSPEEMRDQVAREIERWNRVIDQKNIARQ